MTRKHFEAMAEAIRQIGYLPARRLQAERMAVVCKASNPRFDRIRFLKACGV